ncbi:MAG: hypothetical protein ACREYF_26995 [Gammaproteobacteria bacterium]
MKTVMLTNSLVLSGCLAISPAYPENYGQQTNEVTQERANTRPGIQRPSTSCDGSLLARMARELTPGSYVELPTRGFTDELDFDGHANTVFGYTYEAFWDPGTCRVLFIGGGHLSLTKFLTYSASDNLWTQAPDPSFLCPIKKNDGSVAWGCVNHAYGLQAMDAERGVFYYMFADGNVYGIKTDASLSNPWKRVGTVPEGVNYTYASIEYFREADRIVVIDPDKLSLLDPSSGKWSFIEGPFDRGSYRYHGVYNPLYGIMLFEGRDDLEMDKLDAQGKVTRVADSPREFNPQPDDASFKILTYDPTSGNYLAYAMNGELFVYDVTFDRWSQVDMRLPPGVYLAAVIPSYAVIMLIDPWEDKHIWLYKHSGR